MEIQTQEPVANATPSTLSAEAINNLKQTAPWMTFISIFGFIAAGIVILVSLSLFVLLSKSIFFGIMGAIYLAIGAITAIIYYSLYQTADNYRRYCDLNTTESLEKAFLMQRRYWKGLGIFTIVTIILSIFAVIAYVIFLIPLIKQNLNVL